ncbi:MAG: transcription repressor NadR [Lachnospiraceae bacterium]|nr:transcription repressor NadR [Lachnospiraceae bacterium]
MDNEERRKKVLEAITESTGPISASKLAARFGVSRQIIVGDIALLRAQGTDIIATYMGYILGNPAHSTNVRVKHRNEDVFDEMCTIIDEGARVLDISIEHSVYGTIRCPLTIRNRAEAKAYAESLSETGLSLEALTGGVHCHTIEADNDIILLRVQKALNDKGYLSK